MGNVNMHIRKLFLKKITERPIGKNRQKTIKL